MGSNTTLSDRFRIRIRLRFDRTCYPPGCLRQPPPAGGINVPKALRSRNRQCRKPNIKRRYFAAMQNVGAFFVSGGDKDRRREMDITHKVAGYGSGIWGRLTRRPDGQAGSGQQDEKHRKDKPSHSFPFHNNPLLRPFEAF